MIVVVWLALLKSALIIEQFGWNLQRMEQKNKIIAEPIIGRWKDTQTIIVTSEKDQYGKAFTNTSKSLAENVKNF